MAKLLTRNEARWIAANTAKLPALEAPAFRRIVLFEQTRPTINRLNLAIGGVCIVRGGPP